MKNSEIFDILQKNTIYVNFDRTSSGKGRSKTLGIVDNLYNKLKKKDRFVLSKFSQMKPELHDKIFEFGKTICPFAFTSVQVNHNYKCKKHIDGRNIGESMIIGIGNYTGGRLCVEYEDGVKKIDIKNKTFTFNGSKNYHWVEDFIGERYTLVFFSTGKK